MRGESTYTGYVVDTEIDRGIVFRTSQVYLKTHPRSSAVEAFCLNSDDLEQKAQDYLNDEQKVTVTYSRPLWVNPMNCEGGLSIVQSFEEASGVSP